MTVQTNNNSISYVGNGSTVHFDYDYLILNASHLKVYFEDVLQTSGYVVSGVSSQTGGTVAFAVAPPNGANITLIREVPLLQLTDYQPYDAFPAESHERALDLLTMMAQQLKDELGRTMQHPVGGNKWDAKGNEIINVGTGSSGTSATNINQVKHLIASEVGDDPSASASVRSREALRRSYAEAGYNLVDGSFEAGGTMVNANDVLLHEASGKAFSGPAGVVAAGTNPASGGFVDRSSMLTNRTRVNAAIFASLQDAVSYATSTGKKLVVDGDWSVSGDLVISWFNYDKPWYAEFNGAITATGAIRFQGLANAHINGGTFVAPDIYLQGIRFSSMADMELRGKCYIGKWDGVPAGGSWSLYWNSFESVQFGSILVKTTISGGCSINANEWSTCTFRDKAGLGQLWSVDVVSGKTDPAMAGNTFTNCDWSYAPAWNFLYDYGNSFGANVVGGYLDTGSDWYHPTSALHQRFNVRGLRNPSGSSIGNRPTADDKGTTGSARRTDIHPVSAKSLLKYPVSVITAGTNSTVFHLLPIPCNGDYSLNIITTVGGGGVVTIANTTAGGSLSFNPQAVGQSNCIFSASKGDVVTVTWSTPSLAQDIQIAEISVTLGAGIHGAIPLAAHSPWEYDSGVVSIGTTPVALATIQVGALRLQMRDVLITTRVAVAGGGGEMIELSASMVSGSSAAAITLDEYSRARVNGVGGTSDDPQPLVITTSTSGTSVTILASVATGAVTARCRVGYSAV